VEEAQIEVNALHHNLTTTVLSILNFVEECSWTLKLIGNAIHWERISRRNGSHTTISV
jgi:hypothetical protein